MYFVSLIIVSIVKEKYGSDAEDLEEEDSEDAESEDEDGEELTPAVDAAILRTLARIKRKDPSIYESGKDVFEEERQKTGESTLSKRAPKDKVRYGCTFLHIWVLTMQLIV